MSYKTIPRDQLSETTQFRKKKVKSDLDTQFEALKIQTTDEKGFLCFLYRYIYEYSSFLFFNNN